MFLGATEITDITEYIKLKADGTDTGVLDLREIAKDYLMSDEYILNEVVNIEYNP